MKIIFYLSLIFLIHGCSSPNGVYWCGDHPCINKKEREAFFKKNMIVEFKEINKKNLKENSEVEKIINQAKVNEKNRIKEEKLIAKKAKLEKKNQLKKQKELIKKTKLDEKNRIKEEKDLAKKIESDEKKLVQKSTKKESKTDNLSKDNTVLKKKESDIASVDFSKKIKDIIDRNSNKPYPDINRIDY